MYTFTEFMSKSLKELLEGCAEPCYVCKRQIFVTHSDDIIHNSKGYVHEACLTDELPTPQ